MCRRWGWLSIGLAAQLTWAADLGTWGDLYPVSEPDMLTLITQRLEQLQQSGAWDKEMQAFKERVVKHSQRPTPVEGITTATQYTSRYFDPSVQLAEDIRDDQGRIFARRGEVINPLKTVPFMQTLYFIDADSPAQVAWMKRQKPATMLFKIILVKGDIPAASAALDSRIYFDQNGALCQRLGITSVPARVTPAPSGLRLHIETFAPEDTGQ